MSKSEAGCLLSIIIPVYNVRDYLDICLDSVFKQETFGEDIEILLIDDGSTDGSGALCDQYGKQCAAVRVFHKENGGLSDARNYGMRRARGAFLVFLDSDDFWEQGYIREIREVVAAQPEVDLIFGNYILYFSADGKNLSDNFREEIGGQSGPEVLLSVMRREHQCISSACKNVYARTLLLDNALFFKKGLLCEDAFWSPNVYFAAKNCSALAGSYYCYRKQRENSITNTYNLKLLSDILFICRYWTDYIEASDYSPEFKQLFINEYAVHFRSNIQKVYSGRRKDRNQAVALVRENLDILEKSSRPGHRKLRRLIDKVGLRPVLRLLNIRYRVWMLQKTS
ncbi:MAG: glycosyltransferase family 2 protein [Oscillospiraceae bacterium]